MSAIVARAVYRDRGLTIALRAMAYVSRFTLVKKDAKVDCPIIII